MSFIRKFLFVTPLCFFFSSIASAGPLSCFDWLQSKLTQGTVHFVPNNQTFWDNSLNWTTNVGPAYRDTVEKVSNFVPCMTYQYALCFHSGPEPLPCTLDQGGRFATCKCTIEYGLQYVAISAILNYPSYQRTIEVCGQDGSRCQGQVNLAPVCEDLKFGRLIPGADLISDYSPDVRDTITGVLEGKETSVGLTQCQKGPYAACMTAPCKIKDGYAECSCPVFWGPYTLTVADAQCNLDDGLVWSSFYLHRSMTPEI